MWLNNSHQRVGPQPTVWLDGKKIDINQGADVAADTGFR